VCMCVNTFVQYVLDDFVIRTSCLYLSIINKEFRDVCRCLNLNGKKHTV
jgi:hypothetical protein